MATACRHYNTPQQGTVWEKLDAELGAQHRRATRERNVKSLASPPPPMVFAVQVRLYLLWPCGRQGGHALELCTLRSVRPLHMLLRSAMALPGQCLCRPTPAVPP